MGLLSLEAEESSFLEFDFEEGLVDFFFDSLGDGEGTEGFSGCVHVNMNKINMIFIIYSKAVILMLKFIICIYGLLVCLRKCIVIVSTLIYFYGLSLFIGF